MMPGLPAPKAAKKDLHKGGSSSHFNINRVIVLVPDGFGFSIGYFQRPPQRWNGQSQGPERTAISMLANLFKRTTPSNQARNGGELVGESRLQTWLLGLLLTL